METWDYQNVCLLPYSRLCSYFLELTDSSVKGMVSVPGSFTAMACLVN